MSSVSCSATGCTSPGTLRCSGCTPPQSRYCSQECQKLDWKYHKSSCAATQKYNCILIRATTSGTDNVRDTDYMEPFPLKSYGDWGAEMRELKQRMGWKEASEAGKFYSHNGNDDTWYYYVYSESPNDASYSSLPINPVPSRCIGKEIHGDVAVVRSGPAHSSYPERFSKSELAKTAEFYRTKKPDEVFAQREKSRFMRKMGIELGGVPHLHMGV